VTGDPVKVKDPFAGWRGGVSQHDEPFPFEGSGSGVRVNVIIHDVKSAGQPGGGTR